MKQRTLIALAAFLLTSPLDALSAPPLLNYQGRVAVGATNYDGQGYFKFALVDSGGLLSYWRNDGGPPIGGEPTSAVQLTVTKGLYSVLLGDNSIANMAAIPSSVFQAADLRLRVWFSTTASSFQLLSPDQRLAPAAYLADGVVQSANIASNAIQSSKIAYGAVTAEKIVGGALNVGHFGAGAPSPGQVLGYNGTDIVWTAPGAGGVFSLNGTNAYYNGGNVGVGTTNPSTKLELRTGDDYGLTHTNGTVTLRTYIGGSLSGALGAWLGTQTNYPLFLYANNGEPSLTLTPAGNVGIGTTAPDAGYRLHVAGPARVSAGGSGGTVQFGTPSGESGMSITGTNRADIRFDGTTLKLLAGFGTGVMAATNGIAIGVTGWVGIGTTSPSAKLDVQSSGTLGGIRGTASDTGDGVNGYSSEGIGVHASSTNGTGLRAYSVLGRALYAEGHAGQDRADGGFVKAMIVVRGDGTIARGFNSFLTGDAAVVLPCGFSVQRSVFLGSPIHVIDFGFRVSDRFASVTPSPTSITYGEELSPPHLNKVRLEGFNGEFTVIIY